MTSSYDKSISRQINRGRANLASYSTNVMDVANRRGVLGEKDAKALSEFSGTLAGQLGEWKVQDIKKKKIEGKRLFQQHASEDALALANQIELTREEDTQIYQAAKGNMLEQGANYSDADRIAKLSPWQQVGYVQEKLEQWNESLPDKLDHFMANSQLAMQIGGIEFTPQSIHDDPLALPFKEAALQVGVNKIAENAGIFNYSDELLELAGTRDKIQSAKNGVLSKYRQRYNIDASNRTRMQAIKEWNSLKIKNGRSLGRLLTIFSNTVDGSGNLLGNGGAWDEISSFLASETVNGNLQNSDIDALGSEVIPEHIRKRIGAKPGTTFEQQWPGRFNNIRAEIREGRNKRTEAYLKEQRQREKLLEDEFNKASQEKPLTIQELNSWKERHRSEIGGPVPSWIKSYETQLLDGNKDLQRLQIKQLIVDRGDEGITQEDLRGMHPDVQYEFREAAQEGGRLRSTKDNINHATTLIDTHLNTLIKGQKLSSNRRTTTFINGQTNSLINYKSNYAYWRRSDPDMTATQAHYKALNYKGEDGPKGVLAEIIDVQDQLEKDTNALKRGIFVQAKPVSLTERQRADSQDARIHIIDARNETGNDRIWESEILDGSDSYLLAAKEAIDSGKPIPTEVVDYYNRVAQGTSLLSGKRIMNSQLKLIEGQDFTSSDIEVDEQKQVYENMIDNDGIVSSTIFGPIARAFRDQKSLEGYRWAYLQSYDLENELGTELPAIYWFNHPKFLSPVLTDVVKQSISWANIPQRP